MLNTRRMGMKRDRVTMKGKQSRHKICVEIVKTVREALRVLEIMVFLHSAQDLPTVLKLYGAENTFATD